ncbi:MAG: Npt1/Npt2 family nucleotide transporter [Caldilineaceae bacterium]
MTFPQRLWVLLNVREAEIPLVRLVLLLAALFGATRLLESTAAYALFLERLDAQHLPLVYIGSSLVTTGVSLLYLRLEKRYSLAQLLVGQLALLLMTLVGYRLGLALNAGDWLIFSLPIYDGVVTVFLFMAFWNLLGRIFNLQQGKRLFGLFGAGQEIANILVGCALPLLVQMVGAINLLWCALLTGAGALTLLIAIIRLAPAVSQTDQTESGGDETTGQTTSTRQWLADPYIILLLSLYICFGLADFFVDNIFYARVEGVLVDPAQLAGFLGIFAAAVSSLSLAGHLFFSSYALRRFGVCTIIRLAPLLLLLVTGLYVFSGLLTPAIWLLWGLAVAMNLVRQVTDAFDNTAVNLLFQPLPAALRTRTQSAIDGMIYPAAAGVAGLLLLFLTEYLQFNALQLAYALLPLTLVWFIITWALGRAYPQRVQQALRRRLIRGHTDFKPDRATIEVIQQHLDSPHPGAVLYALDLLATHTSAEVQPLLPPLLHHPIMEVRLAAIAQIEALGLVELRPALAECRAADPDAAVQGAALRALAMLVGLDDDDSLHAELTAANPQTRQGVMVGLLRSGELAGILAVGAQLAQLVNSPAIADRILAAQVLGESGLASFYRPLLGLLRDPEPAVRRAALTAAAQMPHPKLWPVAAAALGDSATRAVAQRALAAGGDEALLAITNGWRTAADPMLRKALARACGRLRSPAAVTFLLTVLDDEDVGVRGQIVLVLTQCGYRAETAARTRLAEAIHCELTHAAWTLAAIVDLTNAPDLTLVREALASSLHQQQIRLLQWLALLYEPAVMRRVRDAVLPDMAPLAVYSKEQRAYALETLDLLIKETFKSALLALYDDLPAPNKLARMATLAPQQALTPAARLYDILTRPAKWLTPWLLATALYKAPSIAPCAPSALATELRAAVHLHRSAPDCLIHESAVWAAQQLA